MAGNYAVYYIYYGAGATEGNIPQHSHTQQSVVVLSSSSRLVCCATVEKYEM